LVRSSFEVLPDLAGALDDAGNEVDPVLREVVAIAPLGVSIDTIGMLQGDRMDGELTRPSAAIAGIGRQDIEPADEAGIDLPMELLPVLARS
jgi:hypothetical protein